MPNHVKPTAEELEAGAKKAAEEAERLMAEEAEKTEESSEEKKEEQAEEEQQEEQKKEEESSNEKQEEEEQKPDDEYKKKFVASSKEALILRSATKKFEQAVDQAQNLSEPTDIELKQAFQNWDDMTPNEQMLAKETYKSNKRFELIHKATQEGKELEQWSADVDGFITDPKTLIDNPGLEGKADDFKIFALKETHRGVDFSVLVKAFLFDHETGKPKNKGKMFENGVGGKKEPKAPVSDKISLSQARSIRQTDYEKYKQLLRDGKIDSGSV